MELFYSNDIDGSVCRLDADESGHCVKVLRHREGDSINVIDGEGNLYRCRLSDASPKAAVAMVEEVIRDWGVHPYDLTMAVCPTKNNERYEWFAEKATEMGVDRIVPVIGDHSERKVFKPERLRRIVLSATKQSLKAALPRIEEPVSVSGFIRSCAGSEALKLIAYCFEGDEKRRSVKDVLEAVADTAGKAEIIVLIGPEGDFSESEVRLALASGFQPVHLGPSRLRTETAALAAVAATYFRFLS